MGELIRRLIAQVQPDRLRERTMELVSIPSPTGESVAVTECYADMVRSIGLDIEIMHTFARSPSTVARLIGDADGPTLTLDGHLDTIHAEHVPPFVEDGRIYGRGAGDMKSGIAAMLEAAQILLENQVPLKGTLILATHTLHEAPVGHMEGLRDLIRRGDVFRDAALVAEGGYDSVAVAGKGQALFEVTVSRPGEVMHENVARQQRVPNPLEHAVRIAAQLLERGKALAQFEHPLLGPETYFLGQVHGGDFYNRVPTQAFLNGTYRYWPDKTWEDVECEVDFQLASIVPPGGLEVSRRLLSNGLGYEVDPQASIVQALCAGYAQVVGREMPLVGALSVSDVNIIVREAGIPAVGHGTGSTTAHADLEWVPIENIARTAQVYLATILRYFGTED